MVEPRRSTVTSDTATKRLLYAIISQMALKDIDWNKVAADPVLSESLTNGHAARMRYSRFKNRMEGNTTPKKQRNPASPRKNRLDKNKTSPRKIKDPTREDDGANVKQKGDLQALPQYQTLSAEASPEAQALGLFADTQQHRHRHSPIPTVKREPGLTQYPMTPGSRSQTPCPEYQGPEHLNELGDMGHMMTSYEIPVQEYGMSGMMLEDPYVPLWQGYGQSQVGSGGEVLVKREEIWEDSYSQS